MKNILHKAVHFSLTTKDGLCGTPFMPYFFFIYPEKKLNSEAKQSLKYATSVLNLWFSYISRL